MRRTTPYSEPFSKVTAPNQLWCMDFKGYFGTGDGSRRDPFTITDAHSRYLIRCQIVSRMDLSQVRAVCEAAVREYGSSKSISDKPVIDPEHVPEAIRIPPAPDASASTLAGSRSCAGCGAHFNRQVNELLHEEAYFLDHAPS
jgi:hypothetical protein